jgi:hypothetical protein
MLDDIKQLKFTSGEEIICRVVNYDADAEDDYGHYMIVDNVLQLDNQIVITQSDEPTAYTDRIYSFKSWQTLQLDLTRKILINPNNIVSVYDPENEILSKYLETLSKSLIELSEIRSKMDEYDFDEEYNAEFYDDVDSDEGYGFNKSKNVVSIFGGNKTKH